MKELSIEEKARRYDEAIKKVNDYYEGKTKLYSDVDKTLDYLFPALKESEGEKVRKMLIEFFSRGAECNSSTNGIPDKDIITWLEKHKYTEEDLDKAYKCADEVQYRRGYEDAKKEIEKQGEVPVTINIDKMVEDYANNKECDNEGFGKPVNCMIRAYRQGITDTLVILNLRKQGEQKPADKVEQEYHCTGVREPKKATGVLKQLLNKENHAWSEEDEAYRVDILVKLEPHITDDNFTDVQNWFKSIKGRVQPKQEWSEEDESHIRYLIECLEHCKKGVALTMTTSTSQEYINWLKSLRPQNGYNPYKEVVESIAKMCQHYDNMDVGSLQDFYDNVKVKCKDAKEYDSLFPQNTWKPSDAQMASITCAVRKMKESPCYDSELVSLLNDLKKLKE